MYLIIVILILFLLICADGRCYIIDDGICPMFEPGSYQINKLANNSFIQFGHTIAAKNQIKLTLDTDASVSFKWRHSNAKDSGQFVFFAPNIENPIECPSRGENSSWDELGPIDLMGGEIKWLLTTLDDIGYLDDLMIKYKGCNVTEFNINLNESTLNNKDVYIKLTYDGNDGFVNNAQLDLIVPQEINISNVASNGFFNNANMTRNNGCIVTFNHSGLMRMPSAEILFTIEIPENRTFFLEISQLIVNGKAQPPLFFNYKWEIDSYGGKFTAIRSDISDKQC
jgi:hypothetical protein